MHRFFVAPQNINRLQVIFPQDISRQIHLVLRLRPGAEVIVLDGLGQEYRVRLTEVASESALGEIISAGAVAGEPRTKVTMLLCLTQREKFEWMLQKCTEVGVSTFIPVISSRSLVQSASDIVGKTDRWQRILREAAEQSHRGIVPHLLPPLKIAEALKLKEIAGDCRLIPWEEEKSLGIREVLAGHQSAGISLLIGPEGGFSEAEASEAKAAGFKAVTLGLRILRMETAAVTAAALVLYERGEMGSNQTAG